MADIEPEEETINLSMGDDEGHEISFDITREALMMLLDIEDPNDEVLTQFFGFSEQEEQ